MFALQKVTGKQPRLFSDLCLADGQACPSARRCLSYKSRLESICWNKAELPVSEDSVFHSGIPFNYAECMCFIFWLLLSVELYMGAHKRERVCNASRGQADGRRGV